MFLVQINVVKLGIPILLERDCFILVLVFCFEKTSHIHLILHFRVCFLFSRLCCFLVVSSHSRAWMFAL